jgi:hypothetical protein
MKGEENYLRRLPIGASMPRHFTYNSKNLKAYKYKFCHKAIPIEFYGRPRTSADIDVALISQLGREKVCKVLTDRYYRI